MICIDNVQHGKQSDIVHGSKFILFHAIHQGYTPKIWKLSKKYSKIYNKIYTYTQYQLQDTTVSNKRSSENHLKLKVYGYYLIPF